MNQELPSQTAETTFTHQDLIDPGSETSTQEVQKFSSQATDGESSQRVKDAREVLSGAIEPTYGPRPDPFAKGETNPSPNRELYDPFAHHGLPLKQVESQQLAEELDPPGFGRLRHPLKNTRITFTLLSRQAKGEYDPRLK